MGWAVAPPTRAGPPFGPFGLSGGRFPPDDPSIHLCIGVCKGYGMTCDTPTRPPVTPHVTRDVTCDMRVTGCVTSCDIAKTARDIGAKIA